MAKHRQQARTRGSDARSSASDRSSRVSAATRDTYVDRTSHETRSRDATGNNTPSSALAAKLAKAAREVATQMPKTMTPRQWREGMCATGVQRALAKAGMPEFTGKFHGKQCADVLLKSGKFELVAAADVRAGDIICRDNAGYGHAAVILGRDAQGKLIEASDRIKQTAPMNSPRYRKTVFLRAIA